MARNFGKGPSSNKFSEHIRKATSKVKSNDQTLPGKGVPETGMERMDAPERGGSSGNREGKKTAPSGTTKNDVHKIKGKVHRLEVEAAHGGAKVRISYHSKKGKHGGGYMPPEEHVHGSMGSAKKHAAAAMDQMEPEEPDTGEMATSL